MLLLSSADFLQTYFLRTTIRVSDGLDQDQDRRSGLGPNCYTASMERVKKHQTTL